MTVNLANRTVVGSFQKEDACYRGVIFCWDGMGKGAGQRGSYES